MVKTNAAWIAKLRAGAEGLGVPIDDATAGKLARFADLLGAWGAKMDLSSIDDLDAIREKHFLDSLAGLRVIDRAGRLADLGSGGGFPGLVLAVARPDLPVLSVESRSKKGVFQRQVARELGLKNVEVRTARIEDVVRDVPAPTWITARALAELHELVTLTRPWLEQGSALVAWKSSRLSDELAAADALLDEVGLTVRRRDEFALPESREPRALLVLSR